MLESVQLDQCSIRLAVDHCLGNHGDRILVGAGQGALVSSPADLHNCAPTISCIEPVDL